MELSGAGNRHLLIRLKSEERKMDMKIDTKFTVESLAKNYEKGRCPRCGKMNMREEQLLNSLSRYCDVYICSDCGNEEAMIDWTGDTVLPFEKWAVVQSVLAEMNTVQGRKKFIDSFESGMYAGRNVEDEEVILMNENHVGMEIWTKHKEKPNWWEIVSYDKDGSQESVTYKSDREGSVD